MVSSFGLTMTWLSLSGFLQSYPGIESYPVDANTALIGARLSDEEHDRIYSKAVFPYIVEIKTGQGHLLFMGVKHTTDPQDPQLPILDERWKQMKPEVALVESRIRPFTGSLDTAIQRGEPFHVYALAHRDKVPIYTLEPPAIMEGEALSKAESPERVLMWLTLRGYLSDRRRLSGKNPPDVTVAIMLSRRATEFGIKSDLKTVKQMDALWEKDFPEAPNWRNIDDRMMWPGKETTYLNRLANVSNEARDTHWAKTMVELTKKGKRVFAVGGASHTIILERILRATLAATGPVSR